MSEEKLVPNLRFSGFDDNWKITDLGEISEVTKLAGFEFTEYVTYSDKGKIIALRGLNIKNNKLDLTDVKYIDNSDFSKLNRSKLHSGDLLFTYVGTIGEVALITEEDKYYLAPNVCRIRSKNSINPYLLQYYFNSEHIKREIKKYVTKSSQPALSMENIRKFKIKFPTLNEQNKIADFLLQIEQKIELLKQKYQKYQDFKKYLMQQIFAGKLRFDFNDEWKQYKLKNLLSVKSSNISINQLEDNTGDYPLYGASGFLKNIDFCEMDVDYISIVKDGSGVGNLSYHERNSSIVNTSQYLLPKKDFNIHFLYYFLQTLNLKKYINGSSIPHIYFKDYCVEKVNIPSLPEQNQIGRLFLDIDKKLENLNKNIELTNEFKKSLLQQMFI